LPVSPPNGTVAHWLASARATLLGYVWSTTAGLVLLTVGLGLLALGLLAGGGVGAGLVGRYGAPLLLAVAVGCVLALGPWPRQLGPWRRRGAAAALGSSEGLARWIGGRLAGVASDLLTLVQLGGAGESPGRGLLGALGRSVAQRLGQVEPRTLVAVAVSDGWLDRYLRPKGRPVRWILLALALGYGGALVVAPLRLRQGLVRVVTLRPPPPNEVLSAESLVADLSVTYLYPAYLKRPAQTVSNTTGELRAPVGTRVRVRARPLFAARQVQLRLYDAQGRGRGAPLVLRRRGELVEGELTLHESGGYRFGLERTSWLGAELLLESALRPVDAVLDGAPRVELVAPADEVALVEGQPVELAWRVEDDVGLRRVALVWHAAGGGGEQRRSLELSAGEPRAAHGRFLWPTQGLAELARRGGGRVAYHVEAVDNRPAGGGQTGVSRTLYLRLNVEGGSDEQRMLSARELLDRALDHLADRLERSAGKGLEEDGLRRGGAALLDGLLPWLQQLARGRGPSRSLEAAAHRVERLLRQEQRGALLPRERILGPLEDVVLGLDRWLARRHGEEIVSALTALKESQRSLRELLAQLRQAPSDEARRRLSAQVQEKMAALEQRLAALMAALRAREQERGGRPQQEFVNGDALERLDPRTVLSELRDRMDRGELDGAAERLARLERQLAQLEQQLSGGDASDEDGSGGSPDEDRAVAELLDQARQLEQEERALAKATDELSRQGAAVRSASAQAQRQAELERQAAELMHGGAPQGDSAQAATRRELLRAGTPAERALARARAAMREAKGELAQGEVHQALPAERRAVESLGQLGQELRNAAQRSARARGESGSEDSSPRDTPIRIPGADQYRPPRELREEILRAMKESPPEPVREQVQRYYRELVK
jgi:hypothetical protein